MDDETSDDVSPDRAGELAEIVHHQQKSVQRARKQLLEAAKIADELGAALDRGDKDALRAAAKKAFKWGQRVAVWPPPASSLPPAVAAILRAPNRPSTRLLPTHGGKGLIDEDGRDFYPIRDGIPCLCPGDRLDPPAGVRAERASASGSMERIFLDVGTKTGNGFVGFVQSHLHELGMERSDIDAVVGVDLSAHRLRAASANGIIGMRSDATCLPFADASFEVTVITELIEHVPAELAVRLLREARRVTRGKIFVQHPDFTSEAYLASLGLKFAWMDWKVHCHHVTVDSLRSLLEEAGIRGTAVEQVYPVADSSHPELVPLEAPRDTARFDPAVHQKPNVRFSQPVFEKQRVIIDLDG